MSERRHRRLRHPGVRVLDPGRAVPLRAPVRPVTLVASKLKTDLLRRKLDYQDILLERVFPAEYADEEDI